VNGVRRPGDLSHLERLIDAWSREDPAGAQATAGRLRRLVSISVLATILDGLAHDGDDRLAFKGGASLELRFGPVARATRDVDALVNVSLGDAFATIAERLATGWEGFTGKVGDRTEITRAGIVPPPQRCKIKLAYKGKPFHTLDFELGQAEAGSFELLERIDNAVDLDRVRLGPAGEVTVLNVHYQIAQKLHACTEVPTEGDNPRVHDLYDILLLAGLAERDGLAATRAACEDTFDHRARHAWPPDLPPWDSWEQVWASLGIPDRASFSYVEARERVIDLIARIAAA
jgi:hypothetical protein